MPASKPEKWGEDVEVLIREGKNYKDTNAALIEKHGVIGKISGSTYGKYRQRVNPTEDREIGLEAGKERREAKEAKVKKRPEWNKTKQKNADESKLAELINKGLYAGVMPFCSTKALKQEDVDNINLGGAVVGSVLYFFPTVNLDHPLVILTTRSILFYLRFRQICATIKEKVGTVVEEAKLRLSDNKEPWVGSQKE